MKKKQVSSNIQTNHTLGEYQRYFSHLLTKGKLKRYKLTEKNKLNPKRQYWKITDEKGETYYYELPKYLKPNYTKSAYSMKRVMHRRPARVALAIFAGTALLSFTSSIVTKNIFAPHFPDVPPQPVDFDELQKKLKEFQDWQGGDITKDATKEFSISDLSTIATASALYDPNSYHDNDPGYDRRPMLAIGHGNTVTTVPIIYLKVYVKISNAFIFQNGNALEESISYSDDIMAPKVGRRDYYFNDEEKVEANNGDASSDIDITWSNDIYRTFTKEAYLAEVAKIPDSPFLYSIDNETVLEGSTATKTSDGYQIDINLDTTKGVARYVKRMKYLSGKDVDLFKSVKITLCTDHNLQLISQEVNESYEVHPSLPTVGHLKTNFYYTDVPDIPNRDKSFDYRSYPTE